MDLIGGAARLDSRPHHTYRHLLPFLSQRRGAAYIPSTRTLGHHDFPFPESGAAGEPLTGGALGAEERRGYSLPGELYQLSQ